MTTAIHTRDATGGADILNVDTAERIITTVVVPYDEYASVPYAGQVWREKFVPGAFAGIEAVDPQSIRVCREHDRSDVVGKCLAFDANSALGLIAQIKIANTARGTETLQLAAEDMLSASNGFLAAPSDVRLDRVTRTRTVIRAQVDHIGLVMSPAYSGARVVGVRSAIGHYLNDPVVAWAQWRTDPVVRWARQRATSHQRSIR